MKKVLVIGAARSGSAVSRLLASKQYDVYLTDMKEIANKEELESLGIHVYDCGHPEFLKELDLEFVVKNPGIPYRVPFIAHFVEKQVPIYTEVEIAYRYASNYTYGAITGTMATATPIIPSMTFIGDNLKPPSSPISSASSIML